MSVTWLFMQGSNNKTHDEDTIRSSVLPSVEDLKSLRAEFTIKIAPWDEYVSVKANLLHLSSRNGWLRVTEDLITRYRFDPETRDNKGHMCLHYAALGNHVDIVRYLTTVCHCIPVAANDNGTNVLHFAATYGSLDVIKYLFDHCHVDPMVTDLVGKTCLHYAIKHIDLVKYLIVEREINPMVTDKDENTVLHCAAMNRSLDVMKYLINDHNCDIMATNRFGKTIFDFAMKHIDVMKYLITECGCDPMATNTVGRTILHRASMHIDTVMHLITECGCDPMATDTNNNTTLHYAAKEGSPDVLKYLINECNCDLMAVNKDGRTALHMAVIGDNINAIECLLSTGEYDPLTDEDKHGKTSLQLAKEKHQNILPLFTKFDQIKAANNIDSYVNILLLGNSGAGKSTLDGVISTTAAHSTVLGSYRNTKGVKPCTVGIVLTKLQHKTLGNVILYDFAGHSNYYPSHSAVTENLLQNFGTVILIVINITDKDAVKHLCHWLAVVKRELINSLDKCQVIIVASHADEINDPVEHKIKEEDLLEVIGKEMGNADFVFLDCRKLGGSSMETFLSKVSSACESVRSKMDRKTSLHCHVMYSLLINGRTKNVLTLNDVMFVAKNSSNYFLPEKREEFLSVLRSLDSAGLISLVESNNKVWVVDRGVLLTDVNGTLFAPNTFKEHVDISSDTGIISVSSLSDVFPNYDPEMLICFLEKIELCHLLNSSCLRKTNLQPLNVRRNEEGEERFLFLPSLLHSERPTEMNSQVYQFGWCLQCTKKNDTFPLRYFHILSLHIARKLSLSSCDDDDGPDEKATYWDRGLHWFNSNGVGVLIEIVDKSQCVLVLMSCEDGCSDNMVHLRRDVIGDITRLCREHCPSLEVGEFLIDPEDLRYPMICPRQRITYNIQSVLSSVAEGRSFLMCAKRRPKLKRILTDEVADISNISILGGRSFKVILIIIIIIIIIVIIMHMQLTS